MNLSTRLCKLCVCLVMLLGSSSLTAQDNCDNCPPYKQQSLNGLTSYGMVQGAQISVEVVDVNNNPGLPDGQGDWSDAQVQAVRDAVTNVLQMPGDNGDSNTYNTDAIDDPPASDATLGNPIIVIQAATQDQVNAACHLPAGSTGTSACTSYSPITTGPHSSNTAYATTLVIPSAISASTLEQLMAHEFTHSILGLAECDGSINCQFSISDNIITSDSLTGPSCCDDNQAKKAWCKCNLTK